METENEKYRQAIDRQGGFGRRFVNYGGCPRGLIGRSCTPLEEEVFLEQVIFDEDANGWIPVPIDALCDLVNEYRIMKKVLTAHGVEFSSYGTTKDLLAQIRKVF